MIHLKAQISQYLEYCKYQKNLNYKTLKAYTIDLNQFSEYMKNNCDELCCASLSNYIMLLNKSFKPKSIKRKIASIKPFAAI